MIEAVHNGIESCSNAVASVVLTRIREMCRTLSKSKKRQPELPLSKREMEVLQLITLGHANKEIARNFGIAISTVKNHIHNIFEKLGVSSRQEAIQSCADWSVPEEQVPEC